MSKHSYLTNGDVQHSHNGRNFISLSPKAGNGALTRNNPYTFNSPKNEGQKALIFSPHSPTQNSKLMYKGKGQEPSMERKNSRQGNDTTPKGQQFNNTMGSYSGSPRYGTKIRLNDDRKGIYDKQRTAELSGSNGSSNKMGGPKVSESVNLRDTLKNGRSKGLEIATDFQPIRTNLGTRSQTIKHKDLSNGSKGFQAQQSYEFSGKYTPKSNNAVANHFMHEKDKNNTGKYRKQEETTSILNRYTLGNGQEKNNLAPGKGYSDKGKGNSFFNSTGKHNGTLRNDKVNRTNVQNDSSQISNREDSYVRTIDGNKKMLSRTQMDLKPTLRDINAGKQKNNNSGHPPTQKVSLQDFVTKVNKEDMFKQPGKDRENSSNTRNKPYLVLDDKYGSKTPKSSNLTGFNSKTGGSRTTTNQEAKTFVFNNKKVVESNKKSTTKTNKPPTPSSRSRDTSGIDMQTTSFQTPQEKKPFIYYMTNMEKYQRTPDAYDYFSQIYREHFVQTYQAMMFCKFLRPVDPKMLGQKKVFLTKRDSVKDKKTLVFDLDETLIHCNESTDIPYDVKLPIKFPHGEVIEAGINVRPYVYECLKELSQHYEIIVFTASHSCYANVVLDYLDPKQQYIHHRLFRDNCVVTEEGIYIKDLRVFANRNLQDVILVDNAAYSFGYQIDNGIPIVPFYENKNDQELRHLVPYLKFLSGVKDLREINRQTFRLSLYQNYDTPEKVLNKLVLTSKN